MPRMDGFGFSRELRKHKHGADVPLIVTSAIYKDQATHRAAARRDRRAVLRQAVPDAGADGAVRRLLGERASGSAGARGARRRSRRAMPTARLARRAPAAAHAARAVRSRAPPARSPFSAARCARRSRSCTARRSRDLEPAHRDARPLPGRARRHRRGAPSAGAQARAGVAGAARPGAVELGYDHRAELLKQLGAQMRAKITNVLRWKDGDWMFTPGRAAGDAAADAGRGAARGVHRAAEDRARRRDRAGAGARCAGASR